ncbi:hypothetical protein HYQ46_000869 [Verticillium longisporum]|nr:hypothetical protein HYQ46_000869 [Verticillium longisporum]
MTLLDQKQVVRRKVQVMARRFPSYLRWADPWRSWSRVGGAQVRLGQDALFPAMDANSRNGGLSCRLVSQRGEIPAPAEAQYPDDSGPRHIDQSS